MRKITVLFFLFLFLLSCSTDNEIGNEVSNETFEGFKNYVLYNNSEGFNKLQSVVENITAPLPCFDINFSTTHKVSDSPVYDYSVIFSWNANVVFTTTNSLYMQIEPIPLGSFPVQNIPMMTTNEGQISMQDPTFSPSLPNVPYKHFNYRFVYSDSSNQSCDGTSQWYYFNLVQ
jgi:hypothetical protein